MVDYTGVHRGGVKEKGELRHDEDLDDLGSGTIYFRRQNMIRDLVKTFSVAQWG